MRLILMEQVTFVLFRCIKDCDLQSIQVSSVILIFIYFLARDYT